MHHIADHFDEGIPIEHARPDFAILGYLLEKNLITNNQYENAIKPQEGISIEGLRPLHYVPEQTTFQKHRENNIIVDIDKEERERRREGKSRRLPRRGGNVNHHITLSTLSSQFEKLLELPVATVPTPGPCEANDTDADISSDDGVSVTAASVESDRSTSLAGSLPLDVDQDEDLINPKRHHQRLKSIRDIAFRNSTILQFDYKSRVIVNDIRNQPLTIPDSYVECCEILRRIRRNILMLKDSGFCQSQISFLRIDPRRTNVALLTAIPVDSILQLGVAFEQGQKSTYSTQSKLATEKCFEIGDPNIINGSITSCPPNPSNQYRKDFQGAKYAKTATLTIDDGNLDREPKFALLRVPDPAKGRSIAIT
jgi:hypothetical protein